MPENKDSERAETRGVQRSTCWSVIVRAQGEGQDARQALGELIKRYENTVVAMFRAQRAPRGSEEDLKQEFFKRMIERGDVRSLDPSRGRFRGWLRVAVKHFLINHRKLNDTRLNSKTTTDPFEAADEKTAELLFMRNFAEETLLLALQRHRAECRDPARFDRLVRFLPGPQMDGSELAALAATLGIPRNRLAVQVYEMREKHKRILRSLIADTLDIDPNDPDGGAAAIALELSELYRLLHDEAPAPSRPENA